MQDHSLSLHADAMALQSLQEAADSGSDSTALAVRLHVRQSRIGFQTACTITAHDTCDAQQGHAEALVVPITQGHMSNVRTVMLCSCKRALQAPRSCNVVASRVYVLHARSTATVGKPIPGLADSLTVTPDMYFCKVMWLTSLAPCRT